MSSEIRKAFVDPDFNMVSSRISPKNPCFRCGKELTSNKCAIHVIDGGRNALHPDDEKLYTPDAGDMGLQYVGSDCMRQIGKEFEVI